MAPKHISKLALGLFLCLCIISIQSQASFKKNWTATKSKESRVLGTISVTPNTGKPEGLKGQKIILCHSSYRPYFIAVGSVAQYRANHDSDNDLGYDTLRIIVEELARNADLQISQKQNCPQVTASNTDGKYTFDRVSPGDYFLFSAFMTDVSIAYWTVPIQVSSGQNITVDLNNSNFEDAANESYAQNPGRVAK